MALREGESLAGSTRNSSETETNRGHWTNALDFTLSCLGFAVGYGNVWRFPYLCYKNGGAAFLIPYYILTICAGLPLSFMELAIGQYTSLGPLILFREMAPLFSGLGWSLFVMCLLAVISYNTIVAWSFFYLFTSFSNLPWTHCHNDYNSKYCYSTAEAASCINHTYYYNRTCLSLNDYCQEAQCTEYNLTHCHHPVDGPISADGILPRISPSEDYFKNRVLGASGKTWENIGGLRWELVGCQALSWFLIACTLVKGVKSLGKVVYITATFPYIVLFILFVRGITLRGAYQGIEFYLLKPNISKLADAEVWSDAAIQIFYSNCIAYGTLINLSSYNKFNNNCMRNAVVISILNSSTSVIAGFVIFSVLGFLAEEMGVKIDEVASSGSGLVFVIYPTALGLLPLPQFWSALFFIMLINLGIGSQISSVETLTSSIYDQFKSLRSKKTYVSFLTCFFLFVLSLTMCLEGGILMFELFFWYSTGLGLIVIAFTQLFSIQFVYGYKKLLGNIREMGIYIPRLAEYYWTICWLAIAPLLLLGIGFSYIYHFVPASWGDYVFPTSIQILGWLLNLSAVSFIPLGMVIACCKRSKWSDLMKSSREFCPATTRGVFTDFGLMADIRTDDLCGVSNDGTGKSNTSEVP